MCVCVCVCVGGGGGGGGGGNKHYTRYLQVQLPAHHHCLFPPQPTVTHSPPEPVHTDLHSALTLPLSTNKTKVSRTALRLDGGVSLTDDTCYTPPERNKVCMLVTLYWLVDRL